MNIGAFVRNQMRNYPILSTLIIGAVGAALFSALGWLTPIVGTVGQLRAWVMSFFTRNSSGAKKVAAFVLFVGLGLGMYQIAVTPAAGADAVADVGEGMGGAGWLMLAAIPPQFGLKKFFSEAWPVRNVAATHTPQKVSRDLKKILGRGVLSYGEIRVFGPIVKAGAGVGAASGKENPEALIAEIKLITSPGLSVVTKDSLSVRGQICHDIFTRGYARRATDINDAAATVNVDFTIPLRFKRRGAAVPIEFGLPLDLFSTIMLEITCSGRQELFTGGTNTYDLTGLTVEFWGDMDYGVADEGARRFHLTEEFERVYPVTQTTKDFVIDLPEGFVYEDFLLMGLRDNVLDDTLINSIQVISGGREWWAHGEDNAKQSAAGFPGGIIRQRNRDDYVTDPAEALTGLYYFGGLRDGGYRRAIDAGDEKVRLRLDVTLGAGAVREIVLRCNRIVPLSLVLPQGAGRAA